MSRRTGRMLMHSRPRCLPSSTKHWTGRGKSPKVGDVELRAGRLRAGWSRIAYQQGQAIEDSRKRSEHPGNVVCEQP